MKRRKPTPPLPTHKTYEYMTPVPRDPGRMRFLSRPAGSGHECDRTSDAAAQGRQECPPYTELQSPPRSATVSTTKRNARPLKSPPSRCACTSASSLHHHRGRAPPQWQRRAGAAVAVRAPRENPPLRDAVDFYRHPHGWSNRLIAGDSLLVMTRCWKRRAWPGGGDGVYRPAVWH